MHRQQLDSDQGSKSLLSSFPQRQLNSSGEGKGYLKMGVPSRVSTADDRFRGALKVNGQASVSNNKIKIVATRVLVPDKQPAEIKEESEANTDYDHIEFREGLNADNNMQASIQKQFSTTRRVLDFEKGTSLTAINQSTRSVGNLEMRNQFRSQKGTLAEQPLLKRRPKVADLSHTGFGKHSSKLLGEKSSYKPQIGNPETGLDLQETRQLLLRRNQRGSELNLSGQKRPLSSSEYLFSLRKIKISAQIQEDVHVMHKSLAQQVEILGEDRPKLII